MAKPLVRLFTLLKPLSYSSKCLGTIRLCHNTNGTTDLVTVKKKEPSEAKKLFELFINDNNPVNLISNIELNKEKIDGRHVVVALTSMYKFYNTKRYPLADVEASPQFKKMIDHLNKHTRTLEMPQIIQALKILNLFQVKSSTTIVQNLLQLIRVSVNQLHPQEIYFLTFLLKRMEPTHLGNAVFTALPEVFKTRLRMKLDVEDLNELCSALQFATIYAKDEEIIQFLVNNIHKYPDTFDLTSAISIFSSLCKNKNLSDGYDDILRRIKDVVCTNIDNLKDVDTLSMIKKIFTKVIQGYHDFYDPILLDVLVNQLIKNNCNFSTAITVLDKLNQMRHIHLPLLNHLINKCDENENFVTKNSRPLNMTVLVQGLADANYKPANWEVLSKSICNSFTSLPDHVALSYLALYIAALDHCDFKMIEKIFTSDQNPALLTPTYRETLSLLYQVVTTLYPAYEGPWPQDEIVDSFKTLTLKSKLEGFPLTPALNVLLKDSAYMKTNVRTNLGHHFDHLILLRNGSPIIIESNVQSKDSNTSCFIEDLNIPADCERIAISLLSLENYGRNIAKPNARACLTKKSLEAMKFKVVHISEETWTSMPDFEIIPYLRSVIGIKNIPKKRTEHEDEESDIGSKKLTEANR